MPEFYVILVRKKNYQNTRIFMIFARKINNISEFYTVFARKMPEFCIIISRKVFPEIWGGGHVPPVPPPSPTLAIHTFFGVLPLPQQPVMTS